MIKDAKTVFGWVIALVLLLLYAYAVGHMIVAVRQSGRVDPKKTLDFGSGFVFVATTIGGLVSALVIRRLASARLTKELTLARIVAGADETENGWELGLAWGYLAVWLVVGLAALIVGGLLYPQVNQNLMDIGKTWLGVALALAYAYFNLKPPGETGR